MHPLDALSRAVRAAAAVLIAWSVIQQISASLLLIMSLEVHYVDHRHSDWSILRRFYHIWLVFSGAADNDLVAEPLSARVAPPEPATGPARPTLPAALADCHRRLVRDSGRTSDARPAYPASGDWRSTRCPPC